MKESNKKSWVVRNSANFITAMGFTLCFVLLWVVIQHREQTMGIFLLAVGVIVSDIADGKTARYFGVVNKFGAAADRLRDKLFQLTMFAWIVTDPRIHFWLKVATWPSILVELGLLTIWMMGVKRNMDVSAGFWGKAKMTFVSAGIIAVPIVVSAREYGVCIPYSNRILICVFAVAAFLGVMSLIKHVEQYRRQLV